MSRGTNCKFPGWYKKAFSRAGTTPRYRFLSTFSSLKLPKYYLWGMITSLRGWHPRSTSPGFLGDRFKLVNSTFNPCNGGQMSVMIFVWFGLALGTLWFRVWRRWVRLLHRHSPAEMVSLAQKLRLGVKAKAAFSQDHPRVVLFGSWMKTELQWSQVGCITLTEELTLCLVFLCWTSNYVDLWWRQSQDIVNRNIFHGTICSTDFDVALLHEIP